MNAFAYKDCVAHIHHMGGNYVALSYKNDGVHNVLVPAMPLFEYSELETLETTEYVDEIVRIPHDPKAVVIDEHNSTQQIVKVKRVHKTHNRVPVTDKSFGKVLSGKVFVQGTARNYTGTLANVSEYGVTLTDTQTYTMNELNSGNSGTVILPWSVVAEVRAA